VTSTISRNLGYRFTRHRQQHHAGCKTAAFGHATLLNTLCGNTLLHFPRLPLFQQARACMQQATPVLTWPACSHALCRKLRAPKGFR
jgi:hypothetical protein